MKDRIIKLLRLPEAIPCDKRSHYLVGSVITLVVLLFGFSLSVAFVLSLSIAYLIELTQKIFKWGSYDLKDAVATFAGSSVVMIAYSLGVGNV